MDIYQVESVLENGQVVLRSPAGAQVLSKTNAIFDAQPGEIIGDFGDRLLKVSGVSWEPITQAGIIVAISDTTAYISSGLRFFTRTIPDHMSPKTGDLVQFDERPEITACSPRVEAGNSLQEDNFDPNSLKRDLNEDLIWGSFSGFEDIVEEAQKICRLHLNAENRGKISHLGTPPLRGLILAGPPGTGKTLLAQIMAKESGAAFYQITTASLGGRLVGESEQRLEAIYKAAAENVLSLVFVDEIDVLTKERGSDHDYTSRLVNVFLTNMDGANSPDNVVTVGTTNRLQDIDRALRRPGRFDREITFRHPSNSDRLEILQGGNHRIKGKISFGEIAARTEGWTAAELNAVWRHAAEMTVDRGRDAIMNDLFYAGFEEARIEREDKGEH